MAGCVHANPMNACSGGSGEASRVGKALYFQSNEQQNSIVSVPIGHDGKLHGGMVTATGGMGGDIIDGATNKLAGPDALSSQGSVVVIDKVSFKAPYESFSPGSFSLISSH